MAILVVRSLPAELDARERVFPAEPVMVSEARRMALDTFRAWGMGNAQAELACLLVSEVVTNAVLHTSAGSPRREFGDFGLEPGPVGPSGPVGPGAPGGPGGAPAAGVAAAGGAVAAPPAPMPWDGPVPVMDGRAMGFARSAEGLCAEPAAWFLRGLGRSLRSRTCGFPGSVRPRTATKAGAASTWWSSSPPGGDRVPPGTAKPSGSRCRSTASRPDQAQQRPAGRRGGGRVSGPRCWRTAAPPLRRRRR